MEHLVGHLKDTMHFNKSSIKMVQCTGIKFIKTVQQIGEGVGYNAVNGWNFTQTLLWPSKMILNIGLTILII